MPTLTGSILLWWILVKGFYGAEPGAPPAIRAQGPYPSEALCKMAGRVLSPWDPKFVSAQEIQQHEDAINALKQTATSAPHDAAGWSRYDAQGYRYHFNAKGELDKAQDLYTLYLTEAPITPCVPVMMPVQNLPSQWFRR